MPYPDNVSTSRISPPRSTTPGEPVASALTHIAIIHSHFEPGNVTDAVRNHVVALRAGKEHPVGKIVLMSGNRVSGLRDARLDQVESVQIRDLGQDASSEPVPSQPVSRLKGFRRVDVGQASLAGRNLFERIDAALRRAGLQPTDSIVHWHNHSLGKNAAVPFVVAHLATTGWRLLLQIHDLEEDIRPENTRHLLLQTGATRAATLDALRYPVHENIAYAGQASTHSNENPSDHELLLRYARMTTIPGLMRSPPGEPARRLAAVEAVLQEMSR